jgi:hypothetical protein
MRLLKISLIYQRAVNKTVFHSREDAVKLQKRCMIRRMQDSASPR